jgi:geranylgeranyl diphosphate synthase type II
MFDADYKKASKLAFALEVFHNFTLLHDDVMDHADQRRGKPTVHKKWDLATAILSGDEMLIRTTAMINEFGLEQDHDYLSDFLKMATEVCQGQQSDMDFETATQVSEDEYTEMIRKKTAVLLAIAMKFGAAAGGARVDEQNAIYEYATKFGIGFQMMDDYLDTFGDERFGKRIGGDILEDKKTWLYIKALQLANAGQKAVMQSWLGNTSDEDEKIEAIRSIYVDLGVDKLIQHKIQEYFHSADKLLEDIGLKADQTKNITVYINWLANRAV